METAKIEATISEQGLKTEVMGAGRDVIMCIAAVINTLAEGIAREGKCDTGEAIVRVATAAVLMTVEIQAAGNSIHIDAEMFKKFLGEQR